MGSALAAMSRPVQYSPDAKWVDWAWLQRHAQTADIVLFSTSHPTSLCIEWAEGSNWSHVGMIVRHQSNNRLYLWEAEPGEDGMVDQLLGDHHQKGVRLVALEQRLFGPKNCLGMLYRRIANIDAARRQHINATMLKWERAQDGKRFTNSFLTMIRSLTPFPNASDPDPSGYFCSQLIVRTFIELGLMPPSYVPSNFSPFDFGEAYDACTTPLFVALHQCKCSLEISNPITFIHSKEAYTIDPLDSLASIELSGEDADEEASAGLPAPLGSSSSGL